MSLTVTAESHAHSRARATANALRDTLSRTPSPTERLFAAIMEADGFWSRARIVDVTFAGMGHRTIPPLAEHRQWLHSLDLQCNRVQGGWDRLLHHRRLRNLGLGFCGLRHVPPALAGLTSLRHLALWDNIIPGNIHGRWTNLPRGLEMLDLQHCFLQQVPVALTALVRLEWLSLADNSIEGDLGNLPRSLQTLNLHHCAGRGLSYRLRLLPQLAALTQLTKLDLRGLGGGADRVQPVSGLDRLSVIQCDTELRGQLTHLTHLTFE